jgi:hypothetical protein
MGIGGSIVLAVHIERQSPDSDPGAVKERKINPVPMGRQAHVRPRAQEDVDSGRGGRHPGLPGHECGNRGHGGRRREGQQGQVECGAGAADMAANVKRLIDEGNDVKYAEVNRAAEPAE